MSERDRGLAQLTVAELCEAYCELVKRLMSERDRGLEPLTFSLEKRHSTTELIPRYILLYLIMPISQV